jgi:hypothetical protein
MSHPHQWWADDSNTPHFPGWGDDGYRIATTGDNTVDWTLVDLSLAADRLAFRLNTLTESARVLTVEARADLERVRETTQLVEYLIWRLHRALDGHNRKQIRRK